MEQDRSGIELRKMREHVAIEGKAILEIGCGDGRVSAMLARFADSIVAIDPDEARLKNARSKVPGVDFRNGCGERLEFPDGTFDIVAFTFSLHHQDAAKALAEAARVVKPGGSVLITEPAMEGGMHPLFRVFRDEDAQIAAAQEAIRNCGLRLERAEAFDIEYVFKDSDEVHQYFFGHFGQAWSPEYTFRLNDLLGGKITARPLVLFETVNIASLTRTQ